MPTARGGSKQRPGGRGRRGERNKATVSLPGEAKLGREVSVTLSSRSLLLSEIPLLFARAPAPWAPSCGPASPPSAAAAVRPGPAGFSRVSPHP